VCVAPATMAVSHKRTGAHAEPLISASTEGNVCLITANVGSIFEIPSLMGTWVDHVAAMISSQNAKFAAIHMQEVGGKKAATSKPVVKKLVRLLQAHDRMAGFTRSFGYFDTNVAADDEYTALGSIYFVHRDIDRVQRYNYVTDEYVSEAGPAVATDVETENLCPFHNKTKFFTGQFGRKRASRKGYLQTGWKLGYYEFQLVNVHLFADDSNIEAARKSPSQFSRWREAAMRFTLDRTFLGPPAADCNDGTPAPKKGKGKGGKSKEPESTDRKMTSFYFGDFNFRLALNDLVGHVTNGARARFEREKGPEQPPTRSTYFKRGTEEQVLMMQKKRFILSDPDVCIRDEKIISEFDWELGQFGNLHELPVTFSPSYPYSENVDEPRTYNTLRAPAWCDRVVMSAPALELARSGGPQYQVIGEDVCMGDHKPVCLSFQLDALAGCESL